MHYQLSHNDTVQVGYVGNIVEHLGSYVSPNTPSEILPPGLNALLYSPYPNFSSGTYSLFASDSHYNGFQTTYERRLSGGLNVLANYTYSNCLTDAIDVLNATSIGVSGYRAM